MSKFCGKCGSKLDDITGLCPDCDAEKIKMHYKKKSEKSVENIASIYKRNNTDNRTEEKIIKKKRKKATNRNSKQLIRKKQKLFLTIIFVMVVVLVIFSVNIITLVYSSEADTLLPSDFNQNSLLSILNEKNIVISEESITMKNETEGTATIVVTLPDYQWLFENAVETDNPNNYLLKAFILKHYETQKFETSAPVTVENGEKVIHSDEVIHKLVEKSLINAINALMRERS